MGKFLQYFNISAAGYMNMCIKRMKLSKNEWKKYEIVNVCSIFPIQHIFCHVKKYLFSLPPHSNSIPSICVHILHAIEESYNTHTHLNKDMNIFFFFFISFECFMLSHKYSISSFNGFLLQFLSSLLLLLLSIRLLSCWSYVPV